MPLVRGHAQSFSKVRTIPSRPMLLGVLADADEVQGRLSLRALPRPSSAVQPLRPGPDLLWRRLFEGCAAPLLTGIRSALSTQLAGSAGPCRTVPPLSSAPQKRDASGFTHPEPEGLLSSPSAGAANRCFRLTVSSPITAWHCHRCGRRCAAFVRLGFRRRRGSHSILFRRLETFST